MLDSARGVRWSIKPAQPISADVESPKWARKAHPERVYCGSISKFVGSVGETRQSTPDGCSEEDWSNFFVSNGFADTEASQGVDRAIPL